VHQLLGVERDRLRVIHHGVRAPCMLSSKREPLVLHVGAIQTRKNILRLMRAFDGTPPEWRLVLAGSNGYGAQEILQSVPSERILHTGYVSSTQLEELYERASILAFPSLDEGFGMPVLEAMAHGVAVLSSDRSALPEVCGDAALLVDPTDTGEIHKGLRSLMEDETLRERLIKRGLARASQFTWAAAVEKTWAVYNEL
jgi:glycosyltransferase involved in cell wall biosynthesis